MMARAWAFALATLVATVLGAAALPAQEIFWDGFDQGDLCAWSNPPVTVTQETEAFDQSGANDDTGSAQLIGRCAVVEGTIGNPYDPPGQPVELVPDTDFFEVNVKGPVMLRFKLERFGGTSDYFAGAAVLDSDNASPYFGETSCDPVGGYPTVTSRQIYLPENGFVFLDPPESAKQIPNSNKWFINIDDARNFAWYFFDPCSLGLPIDLVGSVDLTYRLTLSIDPVAGPPTIPLSVDPVQMPGDGSVLIYRIDGTSVSALNGAETFIDRTDPGILDTKLYLVRKSGATLTTVAGNDDFDFNAAGFDSKIGQQALSANPHFVIVDNYSKYKDGPVDFDLTIQFLQPLWH